MFTSIESSSDRIIDVHVDIGEVDCHLGDDRKASLRCVGDAGERVDRGDLDGQIDPSDTREIGRQYEQVWGLWQGRERPREDERERKPFGGRVLDLVEFHDHVFESEHRSWIDVERQM